MTSGIPLSDAQWAVPLHVNRCTYDVSLTPLQRICQQACTQIFSGRHRHTPCQAHTDSGAERDKEKMSTISEERGAQRRVQGNASSEATLIFLARQRIHTLETDISALKARMDRLETNRA